MSNPPEVSAEELAAAEVIHQRTCRGFDPLSHSATESLHGSYYTDIARAALAPMKAALERANEVLRSAHEIAAREQVTPNSTGWVHFLKRVDEVLLEQHAIMYPKGK